MSLMFHRFDFDHQSVRIDQLSVSSERNLIFALMKSLPLSLSGVALGIALAAADYHVDWKVALLMMTTVAFLHLYSVTGKVEKSPAATKVFLIATIVSGLAMLNFSFGTIFLMEPLVLVASGYMIIRAVRHTEFVSRGKGVFYILLLFGFLAVFGTYYICSHSFGSWPLLLPALSTGLLSVAARTEESRKTLWLAMTSAGWMAMISYACLRMFDPWHFLFLLSLPLFFIKRFSDWSVFAFSVLTGLGFVVYLM